MLAYKKENLIELYERWRMSLGCSNAAFLYGKPALTIRALDGLFWAEWVFRCEFHESTPDAPIRRVPKRIVSEIEAGLDYVQHLSEWFFSTNRLACEYDYKDGNPFEYSPASGKTAPQSSSPHFTFPWVDEAKIKAGNRTRRPAFTRKRANGLWWSLSVWELLEEDAQQHDMGWLCLLDDTQKAMATTGVQFISQLANWHETQHPTANRGR